MFAVPDLSFFLVAIPAVITTGLGKGGMGSALGMLAVPLMSLVMPPMQAAAIMLPLLLAMDGCAIWGWRHSIDWRVMRIILFPGLGGVAAGMLLFDQLSENAIRLLIGAISILFCCNQWLGHHFRKALRKPGKLAGCFWSAVSGFTSFGIHAGGAPLSIYLLPRKLEKQALAGTTAVFFGIINISKLPAYGHIGQLTSENLLLSAILLPLCPLSVRAGMLLVHKVPTKLFYKIIYTSLLITGIKLISDAFIQ